MSRSVGFQLALVLVSACVPNRPIGDGQSCPCAPGWTCDETQQICVRGGTGGAGGGTGGVGGTGGIVQGDPNCGLSQADLATAYVVPLSSMGTAGYTGQICPGTHPVESGGYGPFDPGPETGPCGRHPDLLLQPAQAPCTDPGSSFTYRVTLVNHNDAACPSATWTFISSSVGTSTIADVSPAGPLPVTIASGAQSSVCLTVTSQPTQQYSSETRVDFSFQQPSNTRIGTIWHAARASVPAP
jgi:hypothetical protein